MEERTTERSGAAERPQESGAAAPGRGGRMSRPRKRDAVLRLLRGEDLETVSRSLGVTAATLTSWRDSFLAAGEAALTSHPADGVTLESERLKARLGEMLLKHELLEQKITTLEGGRPLVRRRWKR
jgi:transposase